MIKLRTTGADGTVVIIAGLSRGNWEKLLERKPILLKLADLGLEADPPLHLVIMGGETEADIAVELARAGLPIPADILMLAGEPAGNG